MKELYKPFPQGKKVYKENIALNFLPGRSVHLTEPTFCVLKGMSAAVLQNPLSDSNCGLTYSGTARTDTKLSGIVHGLYVYFVLATYSLL